MITFVDVDVPQRMATLRVLYCVKFTFIFKVKIQAIVKLSQQIFIHLHSTRYGVVLIVSVSIAKILKEITTDELQWNSTSKMNVPGRFHFVEQLLD